MDALRIARIACCLLGLSFIVLSARELHRAASDQQVSLLTFMNSDTLTCAAVFQEVVLDGHPIRCFSFPTTTVMFPDFALYFVARSITGATAPAMVLCSCALFALQLLGCYLLMRLLTPAGDRWIQTALLLCMGALLLLTNARSGLTNPFVRLPIILTYHGGSLVSLLYGMALLLYLAKAPAWQRRHRLALAALFANTVLGVGSDRLLIPHMLAPGVATLVLMRLLLGGSTAGVPLKRIVVVTAVMLGGALIGQRLLRMVQAPWQDAASYYYLSIENAFDTLLLIMGKVKGQLKLGDCLHWLMLLTLVGCGIHLTGHIIRRLRNRSYRVLTPIQSGLLFASTYYVVMTTTIIVTVCYAGLLYNPPHYVDFDWGGAARYFLPVLFLPFFLVGLWLIPLQERFDRLALQQNAEMISHVPRRAYASTLAMIALVVLTAVRLEDTARIAHADDQGVWQYCPIFVQQLDAIAEEYDLKYGLAAYWEAKVASLLSRRGLRVHQVVIHGTARSRLATLPWLCNSRSNFDTPNGATSPPRYQFILINEIGPIPTASRTQVIERFGTPAAERRCGPFPLLVYNRPSDMAFQELAEREAYIHRVRFQSRLGESIRFEAGTLPSAILGDVLPEERFALEGCVPEGLLSDGPLLPLCEAGTYRVRIVTSSSDGEPSGRWELVRVNTKYGASSVVAYGNVEPGPLREAVGDVTIKDYQRGRALDCRVYYEGTGMLQVHHVEVTRVK